MSFNLTSASPRPWRTPVSQIALLGGQQEWTCRIWRLQDAVWRFFASQKMPVLTQKRTCENERNLVQYSRCPPKSEPPGRAQSGLTAKRHLTTTLLNIERPAPFTPRSEKVDTETMSFDDGTATWMLSPLDPKKWILKLHLAVGAMHRIALSPLDPKKWILKHTAGSVKSSWPSSFHPSIRKSGY